MANILVLPSEVVGEAESGNSYAFPADNIIMSDKVTSVEEAINNKPGEKIPGTEEDSVGGEIFNDYTNNIASGEYSHAEGMSNTASGESSHAEGNLTIASALFSHAEGCNTLASDTASHAEGHSTTASGTASHAEGMSTTASERGSHAEGYYTIASSRYQHVQGRYNVEDSENKYAHIVGWGSSSTSRKNIHTITTTGDGWFAGKVSAGTVETPAEPTEANDLITKKYFDENSSSDVGQKSIKEGDTDGIGGEIFNNYANNTAYGNYSHAEGYKTTASGYYSHTEGRETEAGGESSHAEGNRTEASGMYSHAEGMSTTASGMGSHSEGMNTNALSANASHAEGFNTTSSGDGSHSEGFNTTASGMGSHAEGILTKASGDGSHAEGGVTEASGAYAYAGGYMTIASGVHSHAEGTGTIAASDAQHVQGQYNIEDTEGAYAHIIGGGSSDSDRKNIHMIDWNGNAYFDGRVIINPNNINPLEETELVTMGYVNSLLSGGGSENGNFLSDPMIFPLTIGPTIPNEFSNITKLPDGYSASNTLILSVIDIPNTVIYFGSSSYDFIIRITEDGYVQIRFINNAESIGRQFYLLLCKFSLPSTINIIDLFNNNNI